MITTPHRPALRYFGGKWRLAPWIISHFPEHDCYVEPFAGAASVLIRKPPSRFEYYNDADGRVVNFFRQLRERRRDFQRLIALTPFSREELRRADEIAADPLEDARRLYVKLWQGRGGHEATTGWRYQRVRARKKEAIRDFFDTSQLEAICDRLRHVAIEQDDALAVMRRYDGPGTLFFIDPPYLAETRSKSTGRYRQEFKRPTEHRCLLGLARDLEGLVVLAHPRCDLYEALLGDWRAVSREHVTQGHNSSGSLKRCQETLWLNPRCAAAQRQGELFEFGGTA